MLTDRLGSPSPARLSAAVELAALAAGVSVAAWLSLLLPRGGAQLAPIWLPNGLLLAALLLTPSRRWPAILLVGGSAGLLTALGTGVKPTLAAGLQGANLLELIVAGALLRRWGGPAIQIERAHDLLRVAVVGLAAAMGSGLIAGNVVHAVTGAPLLFHLRTWIVAHSMGLLVVTPILLILCRARAYLAETPFTRRAALALAGTAALSLLVFGQARLPLYFLIPPALLMLAFELEVLGAALGVTLVATLAVVGALLGWGPIALIPGSVERVAVMQVFLLTCLFSSLPVALLNARRRRLAASLSEARDRAESGEARARIAEAAAAQSEAMHRLLADNAGDAISRLRSGGVFDYVSPAVTSMTGWTQAELVGRMPADFVHPNDLTNLMLAFGDLDAGNVPAGRPVDYRFRHKDGRWLWIQSNPRVIRHAEGPSTFVDVARDVTERRALEAELRAARAEAEAATTVKSEFLANMSHELRTPLTAVLGFAELIAGQPDLSSESRRHLGRVLSAGKALMATVNDVLDFSKLEAGQVEIDPAPADAALLARETLDLFAEQALAKGVALHLQGAEGLPEAVLIDANRLRQVLLNLLGNALKFTAAGQVTLTLGHADGRLALSVADTGAGISPEGVATLFQRFSQVDGSSTRRHGGTGLGLAICKGLTEAMGGGISVESEPGRGSTFRFDLTAPAAAAPARPATTAPVPAEGARVLVADDNAANRDLARAVLTALGLDVVEACDGAEAVGLAAGQPFDVVLLDLRMPGLDGAGAARAIRAAGGLNARTPLLAFSADPGAADPVLFDGAVAKPLSPGALAAAIVEAMAGRAKDGLRAAG